ncbi:hypothetical protein CSW98_03140 [Vibrio sp. HA2012]|uniref:COG3014 family protein n=1 Tax=Vibrio sp. HA2012 TaxID=1971595 RepID=UPI000C2CC157|nr:hypothetical protein [Vibrio sp. HA2012]PJC88130.1 hypothetical protein CSW98_03140 [Vibrio sp. HA2012]
MIVGKGSRFPFLFFSCLITACSSFTAGNLFSHYSLQNKALYQSVRAGDYPGAEAFLPDAVGGDILANMEKGRVSFLNAHDARSREYLEQSERAVREQQELAVISISETATDIGALAINDNLTSYTPGDYELGFLHLYLALSYLKGNDLEGALVEIKKANQVQEQARKKREEQLSQAESALKKRGISPNLGAVLAQYPDAGQSLQAVQSGYLLYLSALLYEAAGELNSAYVDYRRALAVVPDNRQVIQGTIRVAEKLDVGDDLARLYLRYGHQHAENDKKGQIIVLDEQSIVATRQGWTLSLPFFSGGGVALHSLSLPYYPFRAEEKFPLLRLNGTALTQSLLTDVNLMAQQDLTERIPMMVTRLVLRVIAKEQLRRGAAQESDSTGNVLLNVWNMLTEQPDTRSWQTLPAKVYSSSHYLLPGEYSLELGGFTAENRSYNVKIKAGETVFVWLSRQGSHCTVWHKQLGGL